MISVCTVFYPWTKEIERTEELFDALIPSIQRCEENNRIELSIVDTGTRDIFNRRRKHDWINFKERILKELPTAKYQIADCLVGQKWHMSKALMIAAAQAKGELFFFSGIDLILPKGFVHMMDLFVGKGEVWVPLCYNLLPGQEWTIPEKPEEMNGWRVAKGIMGIRREDFYSVGGYPVEKIGFRVGIDNALLQKCSKKYKVNSVKCEGLFHLHHAYSKASLPGKIER